MKMYTEEVQAFIARVHARAAQKREEAIKEAEEEERQERIKHAPGGLDPIEVLESLPKVHTHSHSFTTSRCYFVSAGNARCIRGARYSSPAASCDEHGSGGVQVSSRSVRTVLIVLSLLLIMMQLQLR